MPRVQNDNARIKAYLTPSGVRRYREIAMEACKLHRSLTGPGYELQEDERGQFVETEFHTFAHDFGPVMVMGNECATVSFEIVGWSDGTVEAPPDTVAVPREQLRQLIRGAFLAGLGFERSAYPEDLPYYRESPDPGAIDQEDVCADAYVDHVLSAP